MIPKRSVTLGLLLLSVGLILSCSDTVPESSSEGTQPPESEDFVVVAASVGVVRAEPRAGAEAVVEIPRDIELRVVGSSPGWIKVFPSGGGEGWLPDSHVAARVTRDGTVCLEMSLKDAIEVGALDGGFRGNKKSSGDSVILRATGALTASLCPEFSGGLVVENANARAQDMVLRRLRGIWDGKRWEPAVRLRFEAGVETEYIFEAYCLNFDKKNPSGSDTLALGGMAPSAVVQLLSVENPDIKGLQLAIWAVTDNVTLQDAQEDFNATTQDIAIARRTVEAAELTPLDYRLFR